MVIEKLNFENYSLYKKITEFRKKNEELQGDILLKNRVVALSLQQASTCILGCKLRLIAVQSIH